MSNIEIIDNVKELEKFEVSGDLDAITDLGVDADGLAALLAAVGEHALVALDAVGVVIAQHVALPGERLVALPAAEVPAVPVLVHRLRVLATENELQQT